MVEAFYERTKRIMINKNVSYNMMEQMVDYKLKDLMEQANMCKCERCVADVRTLALNELPPKYAASLLDEVMTQFELLSIQSQANIVVAIVNAIDTVSRNPRHDEAI
jgi:competence protein ComFB